MIDGDSLLTVCPTAARELDVNPRTVKRWIKDPKLGFPQPIRIRNRTFLYRSEFDAWKERREAGASRFNGAPTYAARA